MNNYEAKRQAKIDRYNELSEKAAGRSEALFAEARSMSSVIPFGQPILIGHHSEKRDRNYRGRISNKYEQSFKESNRAKYYAEKAAAAENNRSISSDDPEAVTKLKEKISTAEASQEAMKAANRIIKSKPKNELTDAKLEKLTKIRGISESAARKLFEKDFCGRIGFPAYSLQNNNANIRRMKERLVSLEQAAQAEHKETEYEGFTVIENPEENRIQIDFDSRQAYMDMCKDKGINLRSHGFKYSKYNGVWQRHLNNAGRYAVKRVIEEMGV
jgi:hypothetical protein